jgi:hypothetical protein
VWGVALVQELLVVAAVVDEHVPLRECALEALPAVGTDERWHVDVGVVANQRRGVVEPLEDVAQTAPAGDVRAMSGLRREIGATDLHQGRLRAAGGLSPEPSPS